MAFLETNDGVSLFYEERGTGTPILFVGGWCMSTPWWAAQLDGLSDRYRCVAFDPRGYGRSEKVSHGYRMSRFARDIYDVLDTLGLDDCILVGWSTGAATVMAYSELFRDEHLRGAVLVDQSPCNVTRPGWRWGFGNRDRARSFVRAILQDHRATAEELVDAMFHRPPSAEDRKWMVEEVVKTPAAGAAELERDDMNQDWRDVLHKFPVPTIVVAGRHSRLFPNEACEYMVEQMPEAELVVFEESGHCPFMEERDRFNAMISDFAERLER